MNIAVLSGKGGTGKTTVSACLVASLGQCQYIDCDVEEPNGYIFLHPNISNKYAVKVSVPQVDQDRCDGCGMCSNACQFNALAVVKGKVLLFPELCHHCGACVIACTEEIISEVEREIGIVETNDDYTFVHGRLNIGEPISIPIIKELKRRIRDDIPTILDCSPGASCSVVQSIEGCDFCLLVTEPTPFGLHDLEIAVNLVRKMELSFGIVINKAGGDDSIIHQYCHREKIDILLEIPFSKKVAQSYSKGQLPVFDNFGLRDDFYDMYNKIQGRVRK
ncbi:MAG: ATP-binding protein [Mahellales bacterium]|jgi:MinD superfamily P-loop ATPase